MFIFKRMVLSGKFFALSFLAFALSLAAPSAFALSLGTAGNYNAFIFGDFTGQNSDIEGRLAAGGDVSLKNYTVGSGLAGTPGTANTLVVGGDLTYAGGEIQNGNAVVGGTDISGANVRDGSLSDNATLPVDFAAEAAYLLGLSGQLASMSANGVVVNQWGGIYLSGDSTSMMQVFDIGGSALSTTNTLTFLNNIVDIPENATLVFNVSGQSGSMQNFDMNGFMIALGSSYDNVLFNFYEATTLNLSGISVKGSILAPLAAVTANNGNVEGTVIAESWIGGMELHNVPFDGTPDVPNPVPEPGTMVLFSCGLFGLAGLGRRFKK